MHIKKSMKNVGLVEVPVELTARSFIQADALVPLFLDDGIRTQQVASGVAIRLGENEIFILCAAHVTDLIAHGALCVPTTGGIAAIRGGHGGLRLPRGMARGQDKDDVAYLHLEPSFAATLDPRIHPLGRDDVHLHETLVEGDLYSFGGYPVSKSKSEASICSAEVFLYTGGAAAPIKYKNLRYNPDTHVLINFNRKTSRRPDGAQHMPPHPKGISGGGVFAWRKDWQECRSGVRGGHLVAIAHSYLQQYHCLVGTRIHLHLMLIARAFPHLFEEKEVLEQSSALPMLMTLIWYPREDWEQLRNNFVDADKYPLRWNEWRQRAETGLETLGSRGKIMIPIELSNAEILEYCRERNLPNECETRLALANEKLMRGIRETNF